MLKLVLPPGEQGSRDGLSRTIVIQHSVTCGSLKEIESQSGNKSDNVVIGSAVAKASGS